MYLEILLKVVMTKQVFNLGTLYLVIFTIPIILLLTVLPIVLPILYNSVINTIIVTMEI
jgi:hypothetical protein